MPYAVVQTHPNAANVVVRNLRRQEFEYYDPRIEVRVKPKRARPVVKRVQLFPDYLFVKIVDRWRALKSTTGVRELLMNDPETPALLPEVEIARLRAMENDAGCVVLRKPKFEIGDKVRVNAGPFEFAEGLYEGQRGNERVAVLLGSLGRVVVAEDKLVAA